MNKKIGIVIGIIIIIALIVVICVTNKNNLNEDKTNNLNNELNNTQIEKSETKINNDKYTINLIEEVDHYILSVQTNLIGEPFEFSYDSNHYVLDSSSSVFDNAIINTEASNKKVTINLESNQLYKFNFIKKGNEKMKLGKNLIINE